MGVDQADSLKFDDSHDLWDPFALIARSLAKFDLILALSCSCRWRDSRLGRCVATS